MIERVKSEPVSRRVAVRPLDVAVIGLACRYEGAPDAESFWRNALRPAGPPIDPSRGATVDRSGVDTAAGADESYLVLDAARAALSDAGITFPLGKSPRVDVIMARVKPAARFASPPAAEARPGRSGQAAGSPADSVADWFGSTSLSLLLDGAGAVAFAGLELASRALADGRTDLAVVGEVGPGVGVLVLKRLQDADRDGDRVYAVVKAIGSDRGRGSRTPGRVRVLAQAGMRGAEVDLRASVVVGLAAGGDDGNGRPELGPLTSPTEFGCLIKTALALHHRVVPSASGAAFRPWIATANHRPRRAEVSTPGLRGASAHVVLEEHAGSADGVSPGMMTQWETEAVLLGAGDRDGLVRVAGALLRWLDTGSNSAVPLKDLAATLNRGQAAFPARLGLVAASTQDLRERLRAAVARISDPACSAVRDARGTYFWDEPLAGRGRVAFLYPGEGSQYPGMLADLCPHFPEVRTVLDTADRIARESGHRRLPSDQLFGPSATEQGLHSLETAVNVVLSAHWGLHQLAASLGLRPDAVLGHSSGEILALAAAGAVRADRALEIGLGELSSVLEGLEKAGRVPSAALFAVAADRGTVEPLCGAGLAAQVAIDNCPHQVVVACEIDSVAAFTSRLKERGLGFEALPFPRAYHTERFGQALGPIRQFFGGLDLRRPKTPIYSCATAARMPSDAAAIRSVAVEQWVRPVRFRETVEAMYADGVRVFLEIGARGNLTGYIEDVLRGRPHFAVSMNVLRRPGLTQLNHVVASLYAQGVEINPEILYARRRPRTVALDRDLPVTRPRIASPDPATPRPQETPLGSPAEADRAMLSYFATMDAFLETQRAVTEAYFAGGSTSSVDGPPRVEEAYKTSYRASAAPAVYAPVAHRSAEVHPPRSPLGQGGSLGDASADPSLPLTKGGPGGVGVQARVCNPTVNGRHPLFDPEPPSVGPSDAELIEPLPSGRSGRQVSVGSAVPLEDAGEALLDAVVRRTGYPKEMLDLSQDMEADLGIDSIKRVEILGEMQGLGFVPEGVDFDRLSQCRTLAQVVQLLEPARTAANPTQVAHGPWAGEVCSFVPGREFVGRLRLDATTDPVASQHTLGGRRLSALEPSRLGLPVVPFTVMVEWLAQAGCAMAPGRVVRAFRDVQAHRWIPYSDDAGRPVTLDFRATAREGEDDVRVTIRTTGEDPREAVSGTVVLGGSRDPAPVAEHFLLPDATPCRLSAAELYGDQWLFHGPALQAVSGVGPASAAGIHGSLRVLPRRDLLPERLWPVLHTDPIVLDAFTHLLGAWGLDLRAGVEGDLMFPLRVGEIRLSDSEPEEGTTVECRVSVRDVSRHGVVADADLVTPDGRAWVRIRDWEDWRFYWPGSYRDVFRDPAGFFVGESIPLEDAPPGVAAVWLEPPGDFGRPVWRDVLEWVQLGPQERSSLRAGGLARPVLTLEIWGRIAAKEAVRHLWVDRGGRPVYPNDLTVDSDAFGRHSIRSLVDPDCQDGHGVSYAFHDGVAVAVASADPAHRAGVAVRRIRRETVGESVLPGDLALLSPDEDASGEWSGRLLCAQLAAEKSAGGGVRLSTVDRQSGRVRAVVGDRVFVVRTAKRGESVWAWTLGVAEEEGTNS